MRSGRLARLGATRGLHHGLLAQASLPVFVVASADESADPEAARLVEAARAGDCAAFGCLVEPHLPAARRLAMAAVGQASDADEAVQEAAIAAWRRLDGLHEPAAFRAWFLRTVWRKALDRRHAVGRWLARFKPIEKETGEAFAFASADAAPDEELMSRELAQAIARVIGALPRKLRDPFLLAASGDHRYEEIAVLLGTPVGTIKWRVFEARRVIRLKLERLGHGAPR